MTANTADAKRILQGYGIACDELDSLSEEHDRIMSALYSITSDPSSPGGGGSSSDKMGDGVAALVDHCRKIDGEIARYIDARDRARSLVRAVMHENITFGQCLHYRYIDREKPTVSAFRMGYSDSNERAVHRSALAMATEIMSAERKS